MSNRKFFHDSVTVLPSEDGPNIQGYHVSAAEAIHQDEPMPLHFSFTISHDAEAELAKRVASGETVPAAELDTKYGLTAGDTLPLKNWLTQNGYRITQETSDHTSVFAVASAGTVAKTLQIDLARVTKNGITHNAARTVPSLPEEVSGKLDKIGGLQPFHTVNKHRSHRHPLAAGAAEAVAAGTASIGAPPYLPSAIETAYQGTALGLDGSGQSIAILIDTFPLDADLTSFWQTAKVPGSLARITKINVNGGTLPTPEGEESLDAEWTSGIAPGANIRIYATGSLNFAALDAGLQKILDDAKTNPSLRVLSISLGLGEQQAPTAAIRTQNQIFLRLAALGVNVFVSSGDDGSNPGNVLEVEYPASDPNVVAVGGTTLALNPNASIKSETGWAGSGGGKSVRFPRPSWQVGHGVAPGTNRLVPDVAAAANPNTGALVMLHQKPQQIGGTSWSAPTWAGIVALINQARVNAGKHPLPFLNPLLYPLNGTSSFHDVVHGSNGAFHAGAGHDLVTGLGSPVIKNLLAALLSRP